jgi:5-methylcytosine-specific restriction endonuclease McrA
VEHVKFDTQKLQNPEISGLEYQQGTLVGFEVKEYLLAKFGHQCVYCDQKDVPLEVEHVVPKSKGGSDRVSNLTLACHSCNQKKGNLSLKEFLAHDPKRLKKIETSLKKPLSGAATLNALRNQIVTELETFGLPVTKATGAQTKFNRSRLGIPKTHALDASCVGETKTLKNWHAPVLAITATGRGSHQRTKPNKFGFPRLYLPRTKMHHGFQTGDSVSTPKGTGRIAVRKSGKFALNGKISITHKHCRLLQRADGYNYKQFLLDLKVEVPLHNI